MEKILIVGYGGHANSVIDTIIQNNEYEIAGYVDKKISDSSTSFLYLGNDDKLEEIYNSGIHNAVICVGFLGKDNNRNVLFNKLKKIGYSLPVIVDKTAVLAKSVEIGEGTFVGKLAVINTNSKIGKMCIINSKSLIEHDCVIGDFSHVAVNACICGEVKVGCNSFIGANSTIIQCINLSKDCFVKAGSIVANDI